MAENDDQKPKSTPPAADESPTIPGPAPAPDPGAQRDAEASTVKQAEAGVPTEKAPEGHEPHKHEQGGTPTDEIPDVPTKSDRPAAKRISDRPPAAAPAPVAAAPSTPAPAMAAAPTPALAPREKDPTVLPGEKKPPI